MNSVCCYIFSVSATRHGASNVIPLQVLSNFIELCSGKKGLNAFLFCINPLLYRYSFQRLNKRQLLKTLWEKKKLLNQKIVSTFADIFFYITLSLFDAEYEEPKIGI